MHFTYLSKELNGIFFIGFMTRFGSGRRERYFVGEVDHLPRRRWWRWALPLRR